MSTRTARPEELRDKPIGEVASDLTRDISLLVRQEIELAKAEMAEKGKAAAPGLGMIGGAGAARPHGGRSADCLRRAGARDSSCRHGWLP